MTRTERARSVEESREGVVGRLAPAPADLDCGRGGRFARLHQPEFGVIAASSAARSSGSPAVIGASQVVAATMLSARSAARRRPRSVAGQRRTTPAAHRAPEQQADHFSRATERRDELGAFLVTESHGRRSFMPTLFRPHEQSVAIGARSVVPARRGSPEVLDQHQVARLTRPSRIQDGSPIG
jgi:hypothetical protein